MKHYLSLTKSDWQELLSSWDVPKFRASQVTDWIFDKGVTTPEGMKNIGKALQERLKDELNWELPEIVNMLESEDGTTKFLLKGEQGHLIEGVLMRYEKRTSLCVSSQVGCKLACRFCQTGKLGFFRNLAAYEIIAQMVVANQLLKERGEDRRVSHVVYMGMGEPFDNYDAVIKATNMMIGPDEFGLSARHVTVSTSGIVSNIYKVASDTRAQLAVSLHAARDDLRSELMPINRKWKVSEVKSAILAWQKETGRKVTIQYILIAGKNCGRREAKELVKFLHGLKAKVNLIPFNAHPGLPYQRPSDEEIRAFQSYLAERSIPAPVRYSRGLEVSAACGQLAAKVQETLGEKPARKALDSFGRYS